MRPLIICPTRYELDGLRRALGPRADRADWLCSGPGRSAVEHLDITDWAARPLVVLAGLAGGLEPGLLGRAWWITEICRWEPEATLAGERSLRPPGIQPPSARAATDRRSGPDEPSCGIVCASVVVHGDARLDLRQATGGLLVDLESAAFAERASSSGANWAIVRGASDGPDLDLPPAAAAWIRPDGRTRLLAVARHVLANPSDLWRLVRLANAARAALRRVGGLLGPRIELSAQ